MTKNRTQPKKSLRHRVQSLKLQKLTAGRVVSLQEIREIYESPDGPQILVVDDDEVIRNGLKRILEASGYEVILASDGLELTRALERKKPDLVLLDINLPWVDGLELCRLVKEHQEYRNVPIVLMSARCKEEDIAVGFAAGCNHFLPKPFDIKAIHEVLDKTLNKSTSSAG